MKTIDSYRDPNEHKGNTALIPKTLPSETASPRILNNSIEKHPKKISFSTLETNEDGFEENEDFTLENARLSSFIYQKFIAIQNICLFLCLFGLLLSFFQAETEYYGGWDRENTALVWIILGSTVLLVGCLLAKNVILIELLKSQKYFPDNVKFWETEIFKTYLIELFLIVPIPYPFLIDQEIETYNYVIQKNTEFKINNILSLFMISRLYLITKYYLNLSDYNNTQSRRIGKIYDINVDSMYALKCIVRDNPIKVVSIYLVISVLVLGYALRICERPLAKHTDTSVINYEEYWNSIWCSMITITTIGYGDYYPKTIPGRCFVFLGCIWGLSLISIMYVGLSNIISMSNSEEKSLGLLSKVQLRDEINELAQKILNRAAVQKLHREFQKAHPVINYQYYKKENMKQKEIMEKLIDEFRKKRREKKELFSMMSPLEQFSNNFDQIRESLKELKKSQKSHKFLFEKTVEHFVKKHS